MISQRPDETVEEYAKRKASRGEAFGEFIAYGLITLILICFIAGVVWLIRLPFVL